MKYTRRIASLLLALVMVFAMAISASAAMEGTLTGGSITINDAVSGQNYSAYQILYLESYSGVGTTPDSDGNYSGGNYAYKANSAWSEWLKTQTAYVSIDSNGYVTWVEGADVAAFAKLAQAQLNGKTADQTATASSTTVTLSNLTLGYYLVDTTLGTLCSLDTTNPNVVMFEKNEKPTIDKQVQEDSSASNENGGWGDTNDAEIGQIVNFKTEIKAYAGAQNYVMHDKMSDGLTLDATSISVTGLTKTTDYSVVTSGDSLCADCDFHIVFTQNYLDKITTDTTLTVTYSATVNSNAVIASTGNTNEAQLKYGEESSTEWDKTTTYVWSMDVLKYGNGDKNNKLSGAKFVLLNSAKTHVATITDGKLAGWTEIVTAEEASEEKPATDLNSYAVTTDANGSISIVGLDDDVYYLRETEAPSGYNKLSDDVTVDIAAGTVTNGIMSYTPVVAEVNNQSGSELPSTGGMGTTLFYAVGGILVLAAVVLLVTKKRMAAAE